MKLAYAVVFEQTPNNYAAYVPDVPGCISVGKTWREMQAMIREALTSHIEFLMEDGDPAPEPKRSIEQALAYHNQLLTESDEETLALFADAVPDLPPIIEMVEIEIAAPQATKAS